MGSHNLARFVFYWHSFLFAQTITESSPLSRETKWRSLEKRNKRFFQMLKFKSKDFQSSSIWRTLRPLLKMELSYLTSIPISSMWSKTQDHTTLLWCTRSNLTVTIASMWWKNTDRPLTHSLKTEETYKQLTTKRYSSALSTLPRTRKSNLSLKIMNWWLCHTLPFQLKMQKDLLMCHRCTNKQTSARRQHWSFRCPKVDWLHQQQLENWREAQVHIRLDPDEEYRRYDRHWMPGFRRQVFLQYLAQPMDVVHNRYRRLGHLHRWARLLNAQ